MKFAPAELKEHHRRAGLVADSKGGDVWTGDIQFRPDSLNEPRNAPAGSVILLVPHGDPFHEGARDEWLNCVFDVIDQCRQHWFIIMTKRAARQRTFLRARYGDRTPKNFSVGVSAERQKEADERIPFLRDTPAAMRFISLYPLLGPVDLRTHIAGGWRFIHVGEEVERPARREWVDDIKAQCDAAGVHFLYDSKLVGADRA